MEYEWKLVTKTDGSPVNVGDILTCFRGDLYIYDGGRPPQHDGSTGRIYVRQGDGKFVSEYFPSVCGLMWVRELVSINDDDLVDHLQVFDPEYGP